MRSIKPSSYCGRCFCCVQAGKQRVVSDIAEIPTSPAGGRFLDTNDLQCDKWRRPTARFSDWENMSDWQKDAFIDMLKDRINNQKR